MFPHIHFSPACEFLVIVHTAKTGLLRCCLYTWMSGRAYESSLSMSRLVHKLTTTSVVLWQCGWSGTNKKSKIVDASAGVGVWARGCPDLWIRGGGVRVCGCAGAWVWVLAWVRVCACVCVFFFVLSFEFFRKTTN